MQAMAWRGIVCDTNVRALCDWPLFVIRQGLVMHHDGVMYETTGLYGQSFLRRLNTTTGQVLKEQRIDKRFFGMPS